MTAAVDLCEEAGDNDGHTPGYTVPVRRYLQVATISKHLTISTSYFLVLLPRPSFLILSFLLLCFIVDQPCLGMACREKGPS